MAPHVDLRLQIGVIRKNLLAGVDTLLPSHQARTLVVQLVVHEAVHLKLE
jgi:hypothetical protein